MSTVREALDKIPVYTMDGSLLSLSTARAPVTIVAAWATWCKPCTLELPQIEHLNQSLAGNAKARVVTVSIDDVSSLGAMDNVRDRIRQVGLTAPVYLDPGGLLVGQLERLSGRGRRGVAIPFIAVIAPDDEMFFRQGFLANEPEAQFLREMHAFVDDLATRRGADPQSPLAPTQ